MLYSLLGYILLSKILLSFYANDKYSWQLPSSPYHKTCTNLVNDTKCLAYIPNKKRNAPLRTVQLSERSKVIGQLSLYPCKGMSGTAALHIFCNLASKLC